MQTVSLRPPAKLWNLLKHPKTKTTQTNSLALQWRASTTDEDAIHNTRPRSNRQNRSRRRCSWARWRCLRSSTVLPPSFHGWGEVTESGIVGLGWSTTRRRGNRVEVQLFVDGKFVASRSGRQRDRVRTLPQLAGPRRRMARLHFASLRQAAATHEARVYALARKRRRPPQVACSSWATRIRLHASTRMGTLTVSAVAME